MLSHAYFLAKIRFDTAENEPAKILQNWKFKILQNLPEFIGIAREVRLIDWGLAEFYHPGREYNVRVRRVDRARTSR